MLNKEIKIKYVYTIVYLLGFILIKYNTSIFLLLSLKVPSFWKSTSNIPKPGFLQKTESFLESVMKYRVQILIIRLPS